MGIALQVVEREGASVMWQNLRARGLPNECGEWWEVPIQCGGAFGGHGGNVFAVVSGQDKEEVQRLAGLVVDGINDKLKAKSPPKNWKERAGRVLSMAAAVCLAVGIIFWITVLPLIGLFYLCDWMKS